jgi:hypothetical protein
MTARTALLAALLALLASCFAGCGTPPWRKDHHWATVPARTY